MSKTQRKIKVRKFWDIKPVTKTEKNDKIYNRNEFKKSTQDYLDDLKSEKSADEENKET